MTKATPDLTELLMDADAACYIAKEMGRNRIHVYHTEDSEIAKRHGEMQWVARIHQALDQNRFSLHAQSIVPLDGGTDRHYELLLRMLDDDGRSVPPGAFLPAAERYNLISKLDRWVVERAFGLLVSNPAFLNQISFCSINLSGQSLADDAFLDFVVAELVKSGIDGEKICFEITETAAISNLNVATTFISTLKAVGCRFALDDFGSGLSSFGYLKNLPVDYLKIDGMFVRDIIDDPIDHAMVKSINDIGHVMGMKTIAEFVENDVIVGMLREIGVNYAQGYGVGEPRLFEELLGRARNVTDIGHAKNDGSKLL
jgi:EAL domain-containing protein (putative c-di-GMP-specific phosphodiesterase class I)